MYVYFRHKWRISLHEHVTLNIFLRVQQESEACNMPIFKEKGENSNYTNSTPKEDDFPHSISLSLPLCVSLSHIYMITISFCPVISNLNTLYYDSYTVTLSSLTFQDVFLTKSGKNFGLDIAALSDKNG